MSNSESPTLDQIVDKKPDDYICRINETNFNRVVKYINQSGKISVNDLVQKTNWKKNECKELLIYMVKSKLINLRVWNNGFKYLYAYYIGIYEEKSPPKIDVRIENVKPTTTYNLPQEKDQIEKAILKPFLPETIYKPDPSDPLSKNYKFKAKEMK